MVPNGPSLVLLAASLPVCGHELAHLVYIYYMYFVITIIVIIIIKREKQLIVSWYIMALSLIYR